MVSASKVKEGILAGKYDNLLIDIYEDLDVISHQKARYANAIDEFIALYGENEIHIMSAPGRSEVGGNHTDHQHGQVLACGVNMDAIAIVTASDDGMIRIVSDDMHIADISIKCLDKVQEEEGTSEALVKGVVYKMLSDGYKVGGFSAYVTSEVLRGSGLSSSACFEVLIGTIQSYLYNNGSADPIYIAIASQYAENVYFGKPCGLMDQMASSVGSLVNIDFEDPAKPVVKRVDVDFSKFSHSLCVVDTKGDHADLTPEYAAVPKEMKDVAAVFGKEYLRDVSEEDFYNNIDKAREAAGDRAVLRAIHFYADHNRVGEQVKALEDGDFAKFLCLINESGDSSFEFLQNVYPVCDLNNQSVALCIALSKRILGGRGAVRVHGGGFAGTMQAFVPDDYVAVYKQEIEKYFGEGSCHVLKIRKYGGMKVL